MRRLVLASTSPWRGELLQRLGLPFEQADPGVDEDPWKARGLAPEDLVVQLAVAKAEALAGRYPDALIVGGDQVAAIDGTILGKPGTAERAVQQLMTLQGRTHALVTGVAVHDAADGRTRTALDVHRMTMRPLTKAQARGYVDKDDPRACAGSYKVESLGIALFERLAGDDWTAIVGLPLTVVVRLLHESGVDPLA
jgi:septum formation protein